MAVKLQWCLLAIFARLSLCDASKILVVFPFPSRSHGILGDAVTDILTEAGHEVWYITPFIRKDAHPNLHQVDVSANQELQLENSTSKELQAVLNKEKITMLISSFGSMLYDLANATFKNKNVVRMIEEPAKLKFDLVVIEWMFSESYIGFAALYECPYIWLSSVDPHSLVLELIDEALNPAYNPDSLLSYLPPFTFIQRVQSLMSNLFIKFYKDYVLSKSDKNMYNEVFGPYMALKGKPLPSFDELMYNASLMLGNSHVSTGAATRLPQNYKPIGGYHIRPTVKPLPEELKKIIENAKNGVIYFSLGSNLKSKDLPDSIKKGLLNTFSSLKYTVIWKFEEILPNLPVNVHILKWAPQPSILSHPKCKLFITHGGLLSTTETIHYGKPIIGIPVFADQFNNVNKAVNTGFARRVDMSYSLADELKEAIEDVLSNPKYTEKVKELSLIYHDRPVSPRKELVHWVEHVIKTGGALHLRSPALLVPWYQKMYLDLLGLLVALYYLLKLIIKRLLSLRKNKKGDSQKKNN